MGGSAELLHVEHSVVFDGTVAAAWQALRDPLAATANLSNLTLDVSGERAAQGTLSLQVGARTTTLHGTARITACNARAHRVVLDVQAIDPHGDAQLHAKVITTVRRAGDITRVRIAADVTLSGTPATPRPDDKHDACRQVLEQFTASMTSPTNEGDVVADQSPRDESAGNEPADAQPVDDPGSAGDITDDVADDAGGASVPDAPAAPDTGAHAAAPLADAAPADATPAFGTPGGIPVPTLDDEPSVNGHGAAGHRAPEPESDLARSTRQAMAKRIAPVAVGLVFVLAAARRRRGRRA